MNQKVPHTAKIAPRKFCMPPALYVLLFLIVFSTVPAWAQNAKQSSQSTGIFVAPLAELTGYGRKGPAFGGGLALGWGEGGALGLRILYSSSFGDEKVKTLELGFFARFYLFGPEVSTGLFVQPTIGMVMFAGQSALSLPAEAGSISAGLAVGWRFPLGNRWYIEPAVRGGYPYMYGAGVSAGFRF